MSERKYDRILRIAKSRGFMWPSSEIYGGIGGFFDYGPLGSLLKQNIETKWREIFVIREGMFEIETPTLMPESVFIASGHIDHFDDPLVECKKCQENYRADHLVEERLEISADAMGVKELQKLINENKIKCKCGGSFSEVWSFNLMFKSEAGSGKIKRDVYLRPETAQGMFVAFDRLYQIGRKKIPLGVCQIGHSFRNEISPRQGMIRLREFTQAEAEIFYNPRKKEHPKFSKIKNHVLPLYTEKYQEEEKTEVLEMTVEDAVKDGIISSELQAYYLALAEKFFEEIGIPRAKMRCRQQLSDERAHYSSETWDIEILSEDFGWVEVAAIADRTDYDVSKHAATSRKKLEVHDDGEKFIPHVMEASFGIDRPFYCLLEQSFVEEEERTYFKFTPDMAPIKVGIFPLVKKDGLPEKAEEIFSELIKNKIMTKYDTGGSIGKRYARFDEIGTPYCITVDHDTLEDGKVTIRKRDSMEQEYCKVDDLVKKLKVWYPLK
tara:strand:+ start:39607 stop:41088 length:1482 start_codon:yes stop_codon:yes gene_type:complete